MTQPSAKVVENRSSRQLTRTALNYRDKHHVNGARKIRTLLTSQLTKEIVSLEDDLIKKGELANALVAKVRVHARFSDNNSNSENSIILSASLCGTHNQFFLCTKYICI